MRTLFRILFITYLLSILTLLLIPTADSGIDLSAYFLGIRSDHWIHATMMLPFLVFCRILFLRKNFPVFLFLGIAFCAFCESLHYFVPYRQFSLEDFYANLTGMCIGSIAFLMKLRIFNY